MSPTGEPLVFDDAEVVQLTWETAGLRGHAVLPSAVAPTSPLLLGVVAIRATGALGTVRAVLVRLSCRSGARARALTVGGWIDGDDEVVQTLTSSYAFPADRAAITIDRRYHVTTVRVVDGRELDGDLDLELREPEPIHPHDVQYVVGLQRLVGPDGERLAQVEFDVDADRAERGRPVVRAFPPLLRGGVLVRPVHPVAGTVAIGRLTLPAVRFLIDPERAAVSPSA